MAKLTIEEIRGIDSTSDYYMEELEKLVNMLEVECRDIEQNEPRLPSYNITDIRRRLRDDLKKTLCEVNNYKKETIDAIHNATGLLKDINNIDSLSGK